MARRARVAHGEFLPDLEAGLREQAAWLASGFVGIRSRIVEGLDAGVPFSVAAEDVWRGLAAVDPGAARGFRDAHRGPWAFDGGPWFTFNPATCVLVLDVSE